MITIKLKIKNIDDLKFVSNKQTQYSFAFRKLYKHYDNLDSELITLLKNRHNLNEIEFRSLKEDVSTKINQIKKNKEKISIEIISLEEELNKLMDKPKSRKNTRKIFRLNKKLQYKNKALSKEITFGGRFNLSKISYLSNDKIKNQSDIDKFKKIYQNNRTLPIYILGEANQKGNRFFDFDLLNNVIYYKPKKGVKITINVHQYNNYKSILEKLSNLIISKSISVSVRLSSEYIYLSFDDELMHGYKLNKEELKNEVKEIKSLNYNEEVKKEMIKSLYAKKYKENEKFRLSNKKSNRYLSIDTNPELSKIKSNVHLT